MKNLKRVLSLALATVMLLGIMVIGANAAFNDQDDIKYDTAVDTLVALKVIDGMGGNNFVPNGTLTRAQAAKMVAYVKAGANKTTVPTALKNPNALTIKIGGTTVTYDGSAAKTVTIADGSEVAY